jgi:hypothetical protein
MGLRLLDVEDRYLFTVGREIEGILNVDRERVPIRARVVRSFQNQVGMVFESLSDETKRFLGSLIDPSKIGLRLKLMPNSGRSSEMIWYHGPFSTDVVVWTEPEDRVLVSFMGSFVQWSQSLGLQTGQILSSDCSDLGSGLVFLQSIEMKVDPQIDTKKVSWVKQLLQDSIVTPEIKEKFK